MTAPKPPAPLDQWKPVETAPPVGTHLLAVREMQFARDWYFAEFNGTHFVNQHNGDVIHPTHWQPMPEPPNDA